MRARDYYGRRRCGTGWVILAYGTVYHFPGRTGLKDAREAIRKHDAARNAGQ
jgi:hypothetical protein